MTGLKKFALLLALSGPVVSVSSCSSLLLAEVRDEIIGAVGAVVGDFAEQTLDDFLDQTGA